MRLLEQEGKLKIMDPETGEIYAAHSVPAGKGNLVRITNPERRRGQRTGKLLEKLGNRADAAEFLERIRQEKTRYGTDQMRAIVTTL